MVSSISCSTIAVPFLFPVIYLYPSLSLCHGFLLAVMYNHRGLEQLQACEDLSPLFNDKTSLKMRT